ncbi:Ctr copper transporter [Venturia nashicola]|uniref:Copper transport protein n=1 Tax=Venturia nashicola TaxID=86259 RepID=A0A4Z1P6Q4_9PEZI|nr:Ctr copper transporter [Venturia nashicola]TLD25660.1 Ctr copper transporter [Venturia nashicola]
MDHSKMHHSAMDHGNMGHGHGDMHRCSMNMLFTWSTQDLCIVFRGWHVHDTFSLIWTLLAIIALTAGYEGVRELSRRYEMETLIRLEGTPRSSRAQVERHSKFYKAFLYAVQVFYSFFIMLLFMTYNGWVMLAVAVGAFVGYLAFGQGSSTKTVACH